MNCCDDYGNCRQGRNCPVRIARTFQIPIFERLFRRFSYWLPIAILEVLWIAFLIFCVYVCVN